MEFGGNLLGLARGDAAEIGPQGLGGMQRQAAAAEPAQGGAQLDHGIVRVRPGAVPWLPPGGDPQAADSLLADAAGVVTPGADPEVVSSAFGKHHRGLDLLGVMIEEPAGSVAASAALLIGGGGEQKGALQVHRFPLQQQHHHQLDRHHVLHVEGASPPDTAVVKVASERIAGPLVGLGGDHVGMAEQKQGRFPATGVKTGSDVAPARRRFGYHGLKSLALQDPGNVLCGRGFIARGICGVDAQEVLEIAGDLRLHGTPVDHAWCLSPV